MQYDCRNFEQVLRALSNVDALQPITIIRQVLGENSINLRVFVQEDVTHDPFTESEFYAGLAGEFEDHYNSWKAKVTQDNKAVMDNMLRQQLGQFTMEEEDQMWSAEYKKLHHPQPTDHPHYPWK